MSTHAEAQQQHLAREVAALRRAFAKLLKTLDRPVGEADYTIAQWCTKRGISRAGFYKMRNAGRGPRVIIVGGLRRISREADREWERRWGTADPAVPQEP